ncbi:MAG: 4-hydroxy-tetrahydrodipicolinate reductase [Verrucomicrobiales bacterium]|nr:4-hydroxy-tetrahydrodipicolinate reductase [Verrucomicrobiota bacterium JB025]
MLDLLITGKSGRMGQALQTAAEQNPQTSVTATHDVGEDLAAAMAKATCTIDFTVHSFTAEVVATAIAQNKSLVIGTTGHTDEERAAITEAAQSIPIVFASNYSVGVNTLFWLTRQASRILTQDRYDIEVLEMHHRHKIDSPSGTARTLLDILNQETGTSYQDDVTHGRLGNIGPRPKKEIGMHTLRGGDVIGDHSVIFAADGERVELSHKATSRMVFAPGAVRAAVWLQQQPAGLYDMQDVLGLK